MVTVFVSSLCWIVSHCYRYSSSVYDMVIYLHDVLFVIFVVNLKYFDSIFFSIEFCVLDYLTVVNVVFCICLTIFLMYN